MKSRASDRVSRRRIAGPRGLDNTDVRTVGFPANPLKYSILATLGVGIGLSVLAGVTAITSVLIYVGLAGFLALAFDPLIRAATKRNMPRWLAAGLLALLLASAVVGSMFAIVPAAVEQLSMLFASFYQLVSDAPNQPWFNWVVQNVGGSLDIAGALSALTAFLSDPANLVSIAGGIFQVGTGVIEGATGVVIVTVLTIYFLLALPGIKHVAYQFVRASRRAEAVDIAEEIFASVGSYVGGQALLAVVNALFTFVLMSILGSPSPLLLAVVAFIGALIPVIGTVFGSAIAVLATLSVSPVAALVAAIVLLTYMQVEAYFLSPRVMARAVKIPGSLVIISAIAGAAVGGVLGALLAVPVAGAAVTVVNRVILPRQARR